MATVPHLFYTNSAGVVVTDISLDESLSPTYPLSTPSFCANAGNCIKLQRGAAFRWNGGIQFCGGE